MRGEGDWSPLPSRSDWASRPRFPLLPSSVSSLIPRASGAVPELWWTKLSPLPEPAPGPRGYLTYEIDFIMSSVSTPSSRAARGVARRRQRSSPQRIPVTTVKLTSLRPTAPAGAVGVLAAALVLGLPGTSLAAGGPGGGAPQAQPGGSSQAVHSTTAVLSRGAGYAVEGGSQPVRELQRRLLRGGYAPGPVDGLYGPLTEGAVRRYQRTHRLAVDGVVGPQTRAAISSPSRGGLTREIRLGDQGDPAAVGELQRQLRSLGHQPGPVDGVYGPRTQAAVEGFQRAHGLAADGMVGPQTAGLLLADREPRAEPGASAPREHALERRPSPAPRAADHPGELPAAHGAPSEVTGSEPSTTFRPAYAAVLALLVIGLLFTVRRATGNRRAKRARPDLPSSTRPALGPGPSDGGLRSFQARSNGARAHERPRQATATLNLGVVCAAVLGALVVGAAAGALFASQASPGPRDGRTADSLVRRDAKALRTSASTRYPARVHTALVVSRLAARGLGERIASGDRDRAAGRRKPRLR